MMRSVLLFLLVFCAVSCQKNKEAAPDTTTSEPSRIRVRLAGDILATTESPLPYGRYVGINSAGARGLRDSTLYAVIFRDSSGYNGNNISRGLFHEPDSMWLDLPKTGKYRIIVTAIKRGTGPGVHYLWQNGVQYYDHPFYSTVGNYMDTSKPINRYNTMTDTVVYDMFDPLDSTKFYAYSYTPEVDVYRGDTIIDVSSRPRTISVFLKRLAFGMQFSASGFTGGKLIVEFPGWRIFNKELTPANINSQYFIHSQGEFKRSNILYPNIRINWVKPSGDTVLIGENPINFKRNILTTIHLTLPTTGRMTGNPGITVQSERVLP